MTAMRTDRVSLVVCPRRVLFEHVSQCCALGTEQKHWTLGCARPLDNNKNCSRVDPLKGSAQTPARISLYRSIYLSAPKLQAAP